MESFKSKRSGSNQAVHQWEMSICFIRALLEEGKPKDVKSDLRRDADTHWNFILPQIICIIVVLKVLKLLSWCSLEYLYLTQIIFYLLRAAAMRSNLPVWQICSHNETR